MIEAEKPWTYPDWKKNLTRTGRCPHRIELPAAKRSACQCTHACGAGRPSWPEGAVSSGDCNLCARDRVRVAFWGHLDWLPRAAEHWDPRRLAIAGFAIMAAEGVEIGPAELAPYPCALDADGAISIALDAEVVVATGDVEAWRALLPGGWPGRIVDSGPFAPQEDEPDSAAWARSCEDMVIRYARGLLPQRLAAHARDFAPGAEPWRTAPAILA